MATELKLSRRSVLIGAGAVALSAALPAIAAEPVEYVRFMEPPEMWDRDWLGHFVQHTTAWRADRKTFALGIRLSDEDIAEGRHHEMVASYNAALENTRRNCGFPEEMIRLAANSNETGRWMRAHGRWMRVTSGLTPVSGHFLNYCGRVVPLGPLNAG